jgi:hypothetical protein
MKDQKDSLQQLSQRFEYHGTHIYGSPSAANASPLYAHLSLNVANDPAVLLLVQDADFATQITNLLFGAVQYLLLSGIPHPLSQFYPNLTDTPKPIDEAYPNFRAFCLENAESIRQLVTSRRVQTNEVGRCAALVPAFQAVAEQSTGRPLALVEIGASAGLHLRWDRYGYNYGKAGYTGDSRSAVQIVCESRGLPPPLSTRFPFVAYRVGLDLNPIDIYDEAETRWLKALIWPEHRDRVRLLEAALALAREVPIPLLAGNAVLTLPEALNQVPDDAVLCIFHSYTLNQMPVDVRSRTLDVISAHSQKRNIYRVSQEWYGNQDKPQLELYSYDQNGIEAELLAYPESHGRWLEWLSYAD